MLNVTSFTTPAMPVWARYVIITSDGAFVAWAKNAKEVCKIVDGDKRDLHWAKVRPVR